MERKDSLVVKVHYGDEDPKISMENAIRLFCKKVKNSGLIQELYERQSYEKPSIRRRRKHSQAVRQSETE